MITLPRLHGVFETPRVIFTLTEESGGVRNPKSLEVIEALLEFPNAEQQRVVFRSIEEVQEFFATSGISPTSAVVIFDSEAGRGHFSPTCVNRPQRVSLPHWAQGAQWAVMVHKRCDPQRCARQVSADFCRNFERQLQKQEFPWGKARVAEEVPVPVVMPDTIHQTISNLNKGPDLAAAIADKAFATELPPGSRISWYRVVPEPIGCDSELLVKILDALRAFERVSGELLREDESLRKLLLLGVDLPAGSRISDIYLRPSVPNFSVGRPDLHYTGNGLPFVSEIDEMPGGMPELVHIDATYGINEDRWKRAFDWLCQKGSLLFLVSYEWSSCYIPETEWLVGHMKRLGYPVGILTTDRVEEIEFRSPEVHEGQYVFGDEPAAKGELYFQSERIGTIWRQFPIFETRGRLEDVVIAASEGMVRLIPEFAHFGNKSWFSIFRSHEAFYRGSLDPDTFEILDAVLPHSYIVGGDGQAAYPFTVNGYEVGSFEELKHGLPQEARDHMVLKICGANNLAARSYGVLMGKGIKEGEWSSWISDRCFAKQPFIVQRRLDPGTVRLPVMNLKTGSPELFSCRVLARPWSVNGELVSVHGTAAPSHLWKVHGMVDMAVVPFAI